MKELTFNDIDFQSIIKLFDDYQVDELNLKENGLKLEIKRDLPLDMRPPAAPVAPYPMPTVQQAVPETANSPAKGSGSSEKTSQPEQTEDNQYHKIVSPMVGTFYRAPAPTSEPFVREGTTISADSTVCIVEAMKMMNEIKSEVEGKIVKILLKNADPVQPGDPLFLVDIN